MRFQRQTILTEVGEAGQRFLNQSKVLIVGAGGLGHPALQYLIGMGIGHIGLVDGDVVDESNLHRQILFSKKDLGRNKAECLASLFREREETCVIKAYPFFLNKKTAFEIFPGYDVILDGSDNFSTKFLINDVCCVLSKPMVFGSISQFEGQIASFWKKMWPCYRCFVPEIPRAKIQNCTEAGVVGALPGIVGSMQALEVMKLIFLMNKHKTSLTPLLGKLMSFDLAYNIFNTFDLAVKTNCKCHASGFDADSVTDIEIPALSCVSASKGLLLDVREKEEWDQFHIPSSIHWPLSLLESGRFPEQLRDQQMTAICKSGIRAEIACQMMRDKGFKINFTKQSVYGIEIRKT